MSVTISGSGQIVKQVIQTVKSDAFSSSVKTTWTDITGLSASITPTNSANKIMVVVALSGTGGANDYARGFSVTRNGTRLTTGNAGSGTSASMVIPETAASRNGTTINYTFLDSPATTSATTYQVQFWVPTSAGGTVYINTASNVDGNTFLCISTITLYEIAYA